MSPSATNGAASANGENVPGMFVQRGRLPANIADRHLEVGVVPVPKVEGTWTVDKALDTFSATKPAEGTASPVPYFHILERLKTTKREGWKRFGINRCVTSCSRSTPPLY